mmetsp:Transcript_36978/g.93383  ORF Transcript_36978/g.93383 Transcript_36978/m.93383 type:complete len:259 (-) Transcript_36978:1435-2211(-)
MQQRRPRAEDLLPEAKLRQTGAGKAAIRKQPDRQPRLQAGHVHLQRPPLPIGRVRPLSSSAASACSMSPAVERATGTVGTTAALRVSPPPPLQCSSQALCIPTSASTMARRHSPASVGPTHADAKLLAMVSSGMPPGKAEHPWPSARWRQAFQADRRAGAARCSTLPGGSRASAPAIASSAASRRDTACPRVACASAAQRPNTGRCTSRRSGLSTARASSRRGSCAVELPPAVATTRSTASTLGVAAAQSRLGRQAAR